MTDTAALRGQAGAVIVDLQLAHKAVDAAAGFIGAGVTDEQVAAARRALTDLQRALWPVAHASDTAAQVTVKMHEGKWAMNCSCGVSNVGFSDSGDATRAGATHLYRDHGIYAGGHKPTMAAMEAPNGE